MYRRSLEELIADSAQKVRPAERLLVSETAAKYRYLDNPGSFVGYWDNDFAPYLVEPMNMLNSNLHTKLIFVGPARTGKSDMFLNWLLNMGMCDPYDMLIYHMTRTTAKEWSEKDLARLFRHSEEAQKLLIPGKRNDAIFAKHFLSGMQLLVNWPTASNLSGKTFPRVWLMDYDRMPTDIDGEGAPFDLAAKRTETYGRNAMTVAESSPGFVCEDPKWQKQTPHQAPPCEGILSYFNQGDRRLRYWRCRKCGHSYEPKFSLLVYPESADLEDAAAQTKLRCPTCAHEIEHRMKNEMDRAGKWLREGQIWHPDGMVTGTPVVSETASFWLKGPCAAFNTWSNLVLTYLNAERDLERTGSDAKLKKTITADQGEVYAPKGLYEDNRLPEHLKARSKPYCKNGEIPEGVRFLVANIDNQKNRFVVQVHGFMRSAIGGVGDIVVVDRFDVRQSNRLRDDDPTQTQFYNVSPASHMEDFLLLIKQVFLKTYELADGSGRRMRIMHSTMDLGGFSGKPEDAGTTANAYNFWRYLHDGPDPDQQLDDGWMPGLAQRVILTKGEPKPMAPLAHIDFPNADTKGKYAGPRGEIPVLFLNTNLCKDAIDNMLHREDRGGTILFPDFLPPTLYNELLAEVKSAKGWVNPRKARNEAFDLLYNAYGLAFSNRVGIDQIDWSDPPPWAADWDENDMISEADAPIAYTEDEDEDEDDRYKALSESLG